MSGPITYLIGDATRPQTGGPVVIAQVCNDAGAWGRGFVVAVSRRWSRPERMYRAWAADPAGGFGLGMVQPVRVDEGVWVANMIAQHGYGREIDGVPPIRYDALEACLRKVAGFAAARRASVAMPRIGCGLAGGTWPEVEERIVAAFAGSGVRVSVYDLPGVESP